MKLEVVLVDGPSPCCEAPVWELEAPAGPFRFCGACSRQVKP